MPQGQYPAVAFAAAAAAAAAATAAAAAATVNRTGDISDHSNTCLACSVVDFGPGWYNLSYAFGAQQKYNAPGKSPALCAEF